MNICAAAALLWPVLISCIWGGPVNVRGSCWPEPSSRAGAVVASELDGSGRFLCRGDTTEVAVARHNSDRPACVYFDAAPCGNAGQQNVVQRPRAARLAGVACICVTVRSADSEGNQKRRVKEWSAKEIHGGKRGCRVNLPVAVDRPRTRVAGEAVGTSARQRGLQRPQQAVIPPRWGCRNQGGGQHVRHVFQGKACVSTSAHQRSACWHQVGKWYTAEVHCWDVVYNSC
jgi:hypothetical protein